MKFIMIFEVRDFMPMINGKTFHVILFLCLCWTIGKGRMFYFQTGHETCKHYYEPNVQQILRNAVEWAAPQR